MIIYEHNKINGKSYLRITSDKENYFVKIKNSDNELKNEIMIKGKTTNLEFEEIYLEPITEEFGEFEGNYEEIHKFIKNEEE